MTARELQDALVADLMRLFKSRRYKTPYGAKGALSFFAQNLPKRQSEYDDDPFPYVIVRLDSGAIDTQTDPHKVAVVLLVGVYDDGLDNQGHRTVLEIMEMIQKHYEEKPLLAKQFVFCDPFRWVLQDEESYPYFFGAAEVTFELPAPRREWSKLV